MLPELGRETRGPFVVPASDGAVEDLDGHAPSVPGAPRATKRWAPGRCDTRGVNEDDLRKLEAAGSKLTFGSGQMLIETAKPGTGLYLVVEGQIVVDATEGVRELGPGAVIGERALFSEDGLRTARVRALTHGVVIAVDRAEVDRLCAEDPAFAERLKELY